MANYNIYFSPTGGTKKVADILAHHLPGDFSNIDLCHDIKPHTFSTEDVCIISVPSYGGRVPAIVIERLHQLQGNDAKAILNCVYGNRAWEDTLTELQDTLEDIGFRCFAAIAAIAEHSIFRQFATGRPDADDHIVLADFCSKIQQKIADDKVGSLNLTGNHKNYKAFNGTPFKPITNELCMECGQCAKECPVDAIDADHPQTTNYDKCISCMRCISICPQQARWCDANLLETFGNKMAPLLSGRKENQLFI